MAEIRVERKEGRNIWPWVLGILVALLVLWFLFGRDNDAQTVSLAAQTVQTLSMLAGGAQTV